MTQTSAVIAPLAIPASLDASDPAAADFIAAVELMNASLRETWGNDDFRDAPHTQLAGFHPSPTRRRILLGARIGDELVGVATLKLPLMDNTHSALVHVAVAPEVRRSGLGNRLYAAAEQAAAADGRRTLLGETDHPVRPETAPGPVLAPRSGIGAIPADSAARFAADRKFDLEQVERVSLLNLADAAVGPDALKDAAAAAGGDYALEYWRGACPEELVDAYAALRRKMSTDAPMAGLDLEEEHWDAARVRETERKARDMDAEVLVSAVRHLPTGELAGHTVLMVFNSNPAVAFQDDTLVLREHRGHRLGMLLKTANLVRLREELPRAARVWTWNAAENGYMLSINDTLGFAPAGYSGEWQKTL
ncbi:GNAT family N-acetyltransferase [Arthrobacter sp. ATA002]|uniref:GNAT family N-acetyltransferase n=1 Tax=Arthrobacter sp. ATA002 TaxID=2991715 RepID=UPI0022A69442|nr:GNAT family N-acetyltransferase [Arthrobacter sp. ATA002]WAP52542.1 GNAT family N-acetyltransferase [Arthrobacter sp. ATA002]